jgi:hypothetical protein
MSFLCLCSFIRYLWLSRTLCVLVCISKYRHTSCSINSFYSIFLSLIILFCAVSLSIYFVLVFYALILLICTTMSLNSFVYRNFYFIGRIHQKKTSLYFSRSTIDDLFGHVSRYHTLISRLVLSIFYLLFCFLNSIFLKFTFGRLFFTLHSLVNVFRFRFDNTRFCYWFIFFTFITPVALPFS